MKEDEGYIALVFLIKLGTVFLIVMATLSLVMTYSRINEQSQLSTEYAYEGCLTTCGEKHWEGLQVGEDGRYSTYMSGEFSHKEYLRVVKEFDRTPCIQSCNELLLSMKGVQ